MESMQHHIETLQKEASDLKNHNSVILDAKERLEHAYNKDMVDYKALGETHEKTVTELKTKINELNMYITHNNVGSFTTLDRRDHSLGNSQSKIQTQNWMLKSYKKEDTPKIVRSERFSPENNRSRSVKKRVVKLKPKQKNTDVQLNIAKEGYFNSVGEVGAGSRVRKNQASNSQFSRSLSQKALTKERKGANGKPVEAAGST